MVGKDGGRELIYDSAFSARIQGHLVLGWRQENDKDM